MGSVRTCRGWNGGCPDPCAGQTPASPPPTSVWSRQGLRSVRPEEQPPSRALRAVGGELGPTLSLFLLPAAPASPQPELACSGWAGAGGLQLCGWGGGAAPQARSWPGLLSGGGGRMEPEAAVRGCAEGFWGDNWAAIKCSRAAAAARHLSQRPPECSPCAAPPTPTASQAEGPPRARVRGQPTCQAALRPALLPEGCPPPGSSRPSHPTARGHRASVD